MKRVFLIPNVITAFGLTCGLFVIFKTSLADPGRDLFSLIQASAILLLIAAVADLADGAVARLIKAESEFGGQFDSLSDSVTFGVAPPLLILKSLGGEDIGRLLTFFVIIAAMIYSLCGVLRLVRYNVRSKEVQASGDEAAKLKEKKHFTGLPIPAAAAASVSAALILISPEAMEWLALTAKMRAGVLIAVMLVLGYFMVSRWKFPSAHALHFRVPSFYLVFATGVIAVLFLYGILDYFAEAFFIGTWLYLIVAWTLSIIRLIAGKRSKALEDFEPDDHDE
ncbi:CDP-alcohol phosphatidyltransferase family protein [Chlamydiota bacterium]